jgi:hypothetical protein
MTDEQWEQIRPLAEAEAKARQAYDAWSTMNLTQLTGGARIESAIAFGKVTAEWISARTALENCLKEATGLEIIL